MNSNKFLSSASSRAAFAVSATHLGATLATLFSFGCGSVSGTDESAGEPIRKSQERAAAGEFSTWTAWTMPIDVCFLRASSTDADDDFEGHTLEPDDYEDMKDVVRGALNETWARVPGVSFVDDGECTGSTTNHLTMKLTPGGDRSGGCEGGLGADCEIRANPSMIANPMSGWEIGVKRTLTHEVGHALGLAHEHKRDDASPTSCRASRVTKCVRCKNAVDSGGACSVTDYNACFDGITVTPAVPVSQPQTFTNTSAPGETYDELVAILGNDQTDSSLERLTVYDPRSIMNYCSDENGRDPDDVMPTALDLLGLEMIYPLANGHPIGCLQSCYHTPSGAITRTDALIQTDWAERGALNSGILVFSGPAVSVFTSNFPAGTSTISYQFAAPRTGATLTASGTLVNSNAAHTAVTMTLL